MSRLIPWREWRFELVGLLRGAGFSDQEIRKLDWSGIRGDWAEDRSARYVFDEHMEESENDY